MKQGNCFECEFYNTKAHKCQQGEQALQSMTSIPCLLKLIVINLQDLNETLSDYVYDEEDENNT